MNSQMRGFRAILFAGTAGVLAAPAAVAAQEAAVPATSQSANENAGEPANVSASGTPTTTAPDASGTTGASQIIVTGSRIARRDYSATSPIVTVDAELLEESSAVNLEANLNKLPQFTPALTQF